MLLFKTKPCSVDVIVPLQNIYIPERFTAERGVFVGRRGGKDFRKASGVAYHWVEIYNI